MNPLRAETIPLSGLAERLQQIGARPSQQHSTAQRHVYFSGPHNVWLTVQRRGPWAQLAYYSACPCAG